MAKRAQLRPVIRWAVGRVTGASMVALKLDDHAPFYLEVADARRIATALRIEADAVAKDGGNGNSEKE